MGNSFTNIAVFGKHDIEDLEPILRLKNFLETRGKTVLFEEPLAERLGLDNGYSLQELGNKADLFVVYGGDGTLLGVARRMALYKVPFVGINAGRLGFITDIPSDSMEKELDEILEGYYRVDRRKLLRCQQIRNGEVIFDDIAVNDIVISRGVSGGMIECAITVDNLLMSTQRADGLIVSTPTGSTAYALSVGGPMIYPTVPCLLLIPVAPHSLSNRPIILPESATIVIDVLHIRDAVLYYDMQDNDIVKVGDQLKIFAYDSSIHLLHPSTHNYFDTLSKKLHWNYVPNERQ